MKNITILGWFGSGNLGDDTILLNEISLLKEKFPNSKITVFAKNPDIIIKNFPGIYSIKLPPIMWYRLYKFINIFYFFKVIKVIKKSNLFILGGGGFFSDRQFFAIGGWIRYCKIAKIFGAKVIGFGMGAGPFFHNYNKNIISKSSKLFDFISVRDEISFNNLLLSGFDKYKIFQTIDPAFFTPKQNIKKDNSIGIILHSNKNYFIKEIKDILNNTNYNIKLIITDNLDINLNKDILNIISSNRLTLNIESNPNNIIKKIGSCDFIISQRLHGSIISFTQKVPFLNIYYHHKGKELIKLLGINNFSFDIKNIENYKLIDFIKNKDNFIFKNLDLNYYKKKYYEK